MRILVQKFGGTSVASAEVRSKVVEKIKKALNDGYNPVVVVSAMGRKGAPYATDTLIDIAKSIHPHTTKREMDHLMCCGEIVSAVVMTATLQAAGLPAIILTGGQAGIVTDNAYSNARILKVEIDNLMNLLKEGKIPVVCGFQGITENGDFTTLGRGGSDTTASALGAALNAEAIEIYTDVEGIMTADPRMVSNAQILDSISYGEVCQLAHQGAKVIHPRAVEIAMQKNIPLIVKSTFSDAIGTTISCSTDKEGEVIDRIATGVTYLLNIAQINITFDSASHSEHTASYHVFKAMAENGISVDLINVHPGHIMFTVNEELVAKAAEIIKQLAFQLNVQTISSCAKVSVVGGGMREVPGVMATFVEALAQNKIQIMQTVDSNASISVLVKTEDLPVAVKALHEKFGLSKI